MQQARKPLAFVDETGFIVPNPVFNESSMRYIKGRFIYTKTELDEAIHLMNVRQEERRAMADLVLGADATQVNPAYDTIETAMDDVIGTRETVPSFTASPNRKRVTEGKSRKLLQPNQAELPESLHKDPDNVNLTEEEREDLRGIDTAEAVAAMFGK